MSILNVQNYCKLVDVENDGCYHTNNKHLNVQNYCKLVDVIVGMVRPKIGDSCVHVAVYVPKSLVSKIKKKKESETMSERYLGLLKLGIRAEQDG